MPAPSTPTCIGGCPAETELCQAITVLARARQDATYGEELRHTMSYGRRSGSTSPPSWPPSHDDSPRASAAPKPGPSWPSRQLRVRPPSSLPPDRRSAPPGRPQSRPRSGGGPHQDSPARATVASASPSAGRDGNSDHGVARGAEHRLPPASRTSARPQPRCRASAPMDDGQSSVSLSIYSERTARGSARGRCRPLRLTLDPPNPLGTLSGH